MPPMFVGPSIPTLVRLQPPPAEAPRHAEVGDLRHTQRPKKGSKSGRTRALPDPINTRGCFLRLACACVRASWQAVVWPGLRLHYEQRFTDRSARAPEPRDLALCRRYCAASSTLFLTGSSRPWKRKRVLASSCAACGAQAALEGVWRVDSTSNASRSKKSQPRASCQLVKSRYRLTHARRRP